MSKSLFPRTEVGDTPTRTRKVTAIVPLWVIVVVVILLLVGVLFMMLHHNGNSMDHMPMSFIIGGGYV